MIMANHVTICNENFLLVVDANQSDFSLWTANFFSGFSVLLFSVLDVTADRPGRTEHPPRAGTGWGSHRRQAPANN
jgi:hypothetical protein